MDKVDEHICPEEICSSMVRYTHKTKYGKGQPTVVINQTHTKNLMY